jgi:hypothetical protein
MPFGDGDNIQKILKISTKGRKHINNALDVLGLMLTWTRTQGALFSLQLSFGLSHTNLTMYLRFAHWIIVEVLKNDSLAAITVLSLAKVEEYKQLVATKFPALTNVWAAMDGLKTPIQQASLT